MMTSELKFLLELTKDIYKVPKILDYKSVDLTSFIKLANDNKILYYIVNKILEADEKINGNKPPPMIHNLYKIENNKHEVLKKTIRVINKVLKGEKYLITKTYRGFPYVTHDVDILVENHKMAWRKFNKYRSSSFLSPNQHSIIIEPPGLQDIEIHDKILPGRLSFLCKEFVWKKNRIGLWGEITGPIPSVEAEILMFLADMQFRAFELSLGDFFYLLNLSSSADWKIILSQASKMQWKNALINTVASINGMHRNIYDEPSPIEYAIPQVNNINLKFPYIPPLPIIISSLKEKGKINLLKIPSYLSVRLKYDYTSLHRAYIKLVFGDVAEFLAKYLYFYHKK